MKNLPDLNIDLLNKEDLKGIKAYELTEMFSNYDDTMMQELAYLAFLSQGPWGIDFNIKRGVEHILIDLNLPLFEGKGVSFRETEISPHQIWASQDSLEDSRVEMVRAAINYMNNVGKPIPPVAVWYNKYDSHYRYVAHDGHHRIYICAEMGIAVPAVLMEYWLDNPDDPILTKKMMFLQLNCLVVHLPISQFCSI